MSERMFDATSLSIEATKSHEGKAEVLEAQLQSDLSRIVTECYDFIFNYVRKKILNRDDAMDITQSIFQKFIVKYRQDPSAIRNAKAYLFSIAHNDIINNGKERSKRSRTEFRIDGEVYFHEEEAMRDDALMKVLEGDERLPVEFDTLSAHDIWTVLYEYAKFRSAFDVLDQRGKVILKQHLQGYSFEEIAERYKQKSKSISTWYYEALYQIRTALARTD